MATLNVLTDLTGTVTRQELYDMWADASISKIPASELADTLQDVVLASSLSDVPASPNPGEMVWVQNEQRMYVYHDVMDVMDRGEGTTVSLWLSIGPDRFDCACLAGEDIPAGAVVEPFYDRVVKICRPDHNTKGDSNTPIPIGINQSGLPIHYVQDGTVGETAPEGTWIRVAIDGIMRVLHYKPDTNVSESEFIVANQNAGNNWVGILEGSTGASRYAGGVGGRNNSNKRAEAWTCGHTLHSWTVSSGYSLAYFDLWWSGPTGFDESQVTLPV